MHGSPSARAAKCANPRKVHRSTQSARAALWVGGKPNTRMRAKCVGRGSIARATQSARAAIAWRGEWAVLSTHLPRTCHAMPTLCNPGSARVGRDDPQSPGTLRVNTYWWILNFNNCSWASITHMVPQHYKTEWCTRVGDRLLSGKESFFVCTIMNICIEDVLCLSEYCISIKSAVSFNDYIPTLLSVNLENGGISLPNIVPLWLVIWGKLLAYFNVTLSKWNISYTIWHASRSTLPQAHELFPVWQMFGHLFSIHPLLSCTLHLDGQFCWQPGLV